MQISVTTRDAITPEMRRLFAASNDKVGIHTAIAMDLQSLAKRAFTDSALRPSAWPNKSDGSAATLRKSGTLAKSIRVLASANAATIVSDRAYAAIHQLGGKTKAHVIRPRNGQALKTPYGVFKKVNHPGSKIPARPYMPFHRDGRPTALALQRIARIVSKKLGIQP